MSDTPRCGATTRQSGDACQLPAGWGTDHIGEGRCKHHGGASAGAPKGNKNALSTGEHESIYASTLTEDEARIWNGLDTDELAQLDEQIRLISIRERRMMQRIADLKEEAFTVVEKKSKEGHGPEGPVDIEEEKLRATLGQIQDIEKALTRVQAEHRKLLREKFRMLKDQPADQSERLDELLGRMNALRTDTDDYEPPDMG